MNVMHSFFNIKTQKDFDEAFEVYLKHLSGAYSLNLSNITKAQHRFSELLGFDNYGSLKGYLAKMEEDISFENVSSEIYATIHSPQLGGKTLKFPVTGYFKQLWDSGSYFFFDTIHANFFDEYHALSDNISVAHYLKKNHPEYFKNVKIGSIEQGTDQRVDITEISYCEVNCQELIIWLSHLVQRNQKVVETMTDNVISALFDEGGINFDTELEFDATGYFRSKLESGLLPTVLENHFRSPNMGYFYDKSILTLSKQNDDEVQKKLDDRIENFNNYHSPGVLIDDMTMGCWLLDKLEKARK